MTLFTHDSPLARKAREDAEKNLAAGAWVVRTPRRLGEDAPERKLTEAEPESTPDEA